MKILKWILIIIAVLIIVPCLLALFMKKDYSITKEVVINKPKQQVFDYVKYLKNQNKFNKWVLSDPAVVITDRGADGTVGYVQTWDSKAMSSKGEQEIKNIVEGETIDCDLRFEKPFAGLSPTTMRTDAVSDNQTKVTWTFNGRMPYPMNVIRPLAESKMSDDLGESLDLLKKQLEQ
ncbi:SRPBCC family protein [Chitinophaga sedimenti]|uniref:SRPBCC family protein n=1 Tax=Chitinophaga sedimenti TaxID=2033606 RepID=UPI00200328DD|nr:SRPBCC family protein [Chitinophaga sedimenti]MCK7555902.1 SRPBCC family protein [Chitinophaga sedimenti]